MNYESTKSIKFFTSKELRTLKDPEWLVDTILEVNSLAMMFGPPGGGKSFCALDMALHVATGEDWLGYPVPERGDVIYIATEGINGIKLRVEAWEQAHGIEEAKGSFFVLEPVMIRDQIGI